MALNSGVFFLTVLVLLTTHSTVNGEAVVSLQLSESSVTVGQKVVFTCTIQGITADKLVNFNKIVMENSDFGNIKREQITAMTSVMGLYKALNRYMIERTSDGTAIVYRLTINGTQHEDNGGYSCVVPDEETYDVKQLNVYHAPDSIRFLYHNESEWITVAEDQLLKNLTCEAIHLMPIADVSVSIGQRNITEAFLISSSTNVMCREVSERSKKCPLYADFNMTAEAREFRPKYTDNSQSLTCTLKMRGFGRSQFSTSVKLNVTHGPKVNCPLTLSVEESSNTAKLSCTVYANPLANHLNLSWIINELAGNSITVDSPSSSNEYKVEHTYFKDEPTKVVTTLVFQTKTPILKSVKSTSLNAENPVDKSTSGVIYVKKQAVPANGGSSAVQLSLFFVFISSTLAVITPSMLPSRRG